MGENLASQHVLELMQRLTTALPDEEQRRIRDLLGGVTANDLDVAEPNPIPLAEEPDPIPIHEVIVIADAVVRYLDAYPNPDDPQPRPTPWWWRQVLTPVVIHGLASSIGDARIRTQLQDQLAKGIGRALAP